MSPRNRWLIPVAVVGGVLLLLVVWLVGSRNSLVDKEESTNQSFADLDAQLQRRFDLIPNLVAATQGVLAQERAIYDAITEARARYGGSAPQTEERAEAAADLESALGRLLVVVESNPQLQSSQNVLALQDQLEGTENRINQARRDYNAVVTDYNRTIRRFPRNVVAGLFGFDRRELFEADPAERENPRVDLGVPR
jgi:LemA protein